MFVFFAIMWWLSEESGLLYGEYSWNKFIIAKWRYLEFFIYIEIYSERNFYIWLSILLYGCTTWTLNKRLEKKLDGNYTRMLRAILNKSCRQHSTRHQLYRHLPPIMKTIQVRRTRRAGHCWRSKDELVSDVLLWTPIYGQAKAGRPGRHMAKQK